MRRNRGTGLSIFYRLLIAFLGIVIAVSGVLSTIFYVFNRKYLERHAEEYISQEFETISYYFKHRLKDDLIRDLQLLASNPTLDEFMMSSELNREINARAVERLFLQSIYYTKSYESISFVNVAGKETVRVSRAGRIREYRDMRRSRLFTRIESGSPNSIPDSIKVEDPRMNKDGTVSFSIGIYKSDPDIGKLGGAVIIDYSLKEFFEYLDNIKIFGENPVWVFSPDGQALKQSAGERAFFDPRSAFSKEIQGVLLSKTSDEGIVVYQDLSIIPIPNRPLMRLAISIPSALLLKDVQSALSFFLLVFIISSIASFVIAFYISRYLSRPVIELSRAAVRLAGGDLTTRVKVETTGEVQMLVESFNQMAEDLEKTTVSMDYVHSIINSIHAGIVVIDPQTHEVIDVNSYASKMIGIPREWIIGHVCHKFLCPAEIGNCPITDLKQNVDNAERFLLTAYGRRVPVLKSVVPIRYKGKEHLIESFTDITGLKQAKDELRTFAAQLERSNRELQDFAYTASHDLQEPLRKVMGFGDRLKDKYSDVLGDQGRDYLERMQNATLRMQNFINDLLAFSRVTTKAQPFAPVDLGTVVQEVLSDLEVRIEQVKGRVEVEKLPVIDADPLQMRQVFQNLIGNALKFHKKGEPPVVRIQSQIINPPLFPFPDKIIRRQVFKGGENFTPTSNSSPLEGEDKRRGGIREEDARRGGISYPPLAKGGQGGFEKGFTDESSPGGTAYCRITVEDNGIGFDEKYAERIFGLFQRLHGKDEYEGTGMGLAICKKIVERHGGSIAAKSAPEQGATFIVTLPVKQPKGEDHG